MSLPFFWGSRNENEKEMKENIIFNKSAFLNMRKWKCKVWFQCPREPSTQYLLLFWPWILCGAEALHGPVWLVMTLAEIHGKWCGKLVGLSSLRLPHFHSSPWVLFLLKVICAGFWEIWKNKEIFPSLYLSIGMYKSFPVHTCVLTVCFCACLLFRTTPVAAVWAVMASPPLVPVAAAARTSSCPSWSCWASPASLPHCRRRPPTWWYLGRRKMHYCITVTLKKTNED